MDRIFLTHLERWLPHILRDKALASTEGQLAFLGANDFAVMVADFVLGQLAAEPASSGSTCHLDEVTDDEIVAASGLTVEMVAAGLLGGVVELGEWHGRSAIEFLVAHDVPIEDARTFVRGVETVAESLNERGQMLIHQIDAAHAAPLIAPVPSGL